MEEPVGEAPVGIDVDEAMAVLGLGRAEVYRKVKDGILKAAKTDHRLRFERAAVEALRDKLAGEQASLGDELATWHERLAPGADPDAEALPADASVADRLAEVGHRLLRDALVAGADDLYVDPVVDGDRVVLGRGGVRSERGRLSTGLATQLKTWLKAQATVTVGEDGAGQGIGQIERDGAQQQFRVTVVPTLMGEHLHVRLFPAAADLVELGYEPAQAEALQQALARGAGFVLLADAADAWSERHRRALAQALSAADRLVVALEHRLQHRSELLVQLDLQAAGRPPFDELWRAALAMDPDALLVDEVRGAADAGVVLSGASGSLVLAQVAAADAAAALRQLRRWEIADETLGSVLVATVERIHVRHLCAACRQAGPADPDLGVTGSFVAGGCETCGDGFDGVLPVCGLTGPGIDAQLGLAARLRRVVEAGQTPLAHVAARLQAAAEAQAPTEANPPG